MFQWQYASRYNEEDILQATLRDMQRCCSVLSQKITFQISSTSRMKSNGRMDEPRKTLFLASGKEEDTPFSETD